MNFPKSSRVRVRHEYLAFFKGSKVARLGSCIVFQIENRKEEARVGITVKTKTNSVYRNKVKRQVRESFRLARPHKKRSDYNVVIPTTTLLNYLAIPKIRTDLDAYWKNENRT